METYDELQNRLATIVDVRAPQGSSTGTST